MTIKLSKLNAFLSSRYPTALAEDWDNVGLIVGDPSAQVQRCLLALDVTHDVVEEAIVQQAQVIITHHPLIFRAIKRIDASTTQGSLIAKCLKHDIAHIALHTNLDAAQGGLNDVVGQLLGLTILKPLLDSGKERLYKLVVFVPTANAEGVRQAMFDAGAGNIGNYDHASFFVAGTGTFRGLEGSNPAIGKVGEDEFVSEVRIEVLLEREKFGSVYSAMLNAHPYEEVAYDLIPLHNRQNQTGLGRIGVLPHPITLRQFADQVSRLGMMVIRFLGDPSRIVRKVALCTGAGSDFSTYATSQGADVYLSAEIKHHHALDADHRGLCIVETDHFTLETVVWKHVAKEILTAFDGQVEALVSERERNCWHRYP